MGQFLVLLSNPFEIDKYLKNWSSGEESIPDYRIEVLENDDKTDNFFRNKMDLGFSILVDPMIGKNHNIVKAIPVMWMSEYRI